MRKIVVLAALLVAFVHLNTVVWANEELTKDQEDGIVNCHYIDNANFDEFYSMVKHQREVRAT